MRAAHSPFSRLWRALPVDGRGFLPPSDSQARRLHALAARRIWGRIPWPLRPFAISVARTLWCLKALPLVRTLAGRYGLGRGEAIRMFADACLGGLTPMESFYWRNLLNAHDRPLSSRSLGIILVPLAAVDQRGLLSDKVAAAEALGRAGIAFPGQIALISRQAPVHSLPPGEAALFVKPRHGAASRFIFTADRLGEGGWRINGNERDAGFVAALLGLALKRDDMIVQERLAAAPELAEFAAIRPPVLRIHTLREPGGTPMILSAVLSAIVPRRDPNPKGPPTSALLLPVEIQSGVMRAGFCVPRQRFAESPWRGDPIAGRRVPHYDEARRMALAGAAMLDRVPLIAWEFILTPNGPVMLEGNSEPGLHYAALAATAQPETIDLFAVLGRWAPAG